MKYQFFLLLLFSPFFACRSEDEETFTAALQDITEAVYASAVILPAEYYQVYPEVAGLVEEKWIEAGDEVLAGEQLFSIRNHTLNLQTANARLNYDLAQANLTGRSNQLNELQRQIELTAQQYRQDSLDYHTQQALWNQNIGSRQQVDQRALAMANSKARYQAAIDAHQQMERQLQTEVARTANTYRINTNNQDQFVITSRISGKVYELLVEAGETVNPQQPLAHLGSRDSFLIEMQVDEEDISQIQKGQLVYLTLDSYSDQTFQGRVTKIYPSMNIQSQSFLVEAQFITTPPLLYPNLSAEANIVIRQKESVLVIPRSYLLPGDSVILSDTGLKRLVKTGIQDINLVEITEGLQAGESIRKP